MSAHAVNKIWMRAVDEKQVISLQWPKSYTAVASQPNSYAACSSKPAKLLNNNWDPYSIASYTLQQLRAVYGTDTRVWCNIMAGDCAFARFGPLYSLI